MAPRRRHDDAAGPDALPGRWQARCDRDIPGVAGSEGPSATYRSPHRGAKLRREAGGGRLDHASSAGVFHLTRDEVDAHPQGRSAQEAQRRTATSDGSTATPLLDEITAESGSKRRCDRGPLGPGHLGSKGAGGNRQPSRSNHQIRNDDLADQRPPQTRVSEHSTYRHPRQQVLGGLDRQERCRLDDDDLCVARAESRSGLDRR